MSSDRANLLTPRELQVAVLVRDGLTDREIASKLFITRRTAEWHVEQIFNKLGFNTRAQVAAWVAHDQAVGSFPEASVRLRDNLPLQLTAFIGRSAELSEIQRRLVGNRLLTLTGVAGCGKTRLALEVATRMLDSYTDGACFVDLTTVSDAQLVARAVGAALGVRERPRKPVIETLVDHVAGRRLLVLLDNCEHVIEGCAHLADTLLHACPGLTLLATSREPLRIGGETIWRVPPMAVPDPLAPIDLEALAVCDAVRLFTDRAQLAAPAFHMTTENAPVVAMVCHALDGIPLAIELAAVRVGVMAPAQILDRLRDRSLLSGGSRTGPQRHRSIQSALAWSHDSLSDGERRLFRRLSVFVGSFSLEAVEGVCSSSNLEAAAITGLLGSLVDKSLVSATAAGHDRNRFRLLETIRQYGIDRLAESGEEEMFHERHSEFFVSLAETAFPNLRAHAQTRWRLRLLEEIDNLRSAFGWTHDRKPESSLRLAYALTPFWVLDGSVAEGDSMIEAALHEYPTKNQLRAAALMEGGWVSTWCGDMGGARGRWQEGLDIYEGLGDARGIGQALTSLGWDAQLQGNPETAHKRYVDGLAMSRRGEDHREISISLMFLGQSFLRRGDYDNAHSYLSQSLSEAAQLGDLRLKSYQLTWLGQTAMMTGDFKTARGDLAEGLRIAKTLDFPLGLARGLTDLAELAAAQSDSVRALRLAGAAEAIYESLTSNRFSLDRPGLERWLEQSRQELGPEQAAACWAEGRAMPQERAIEYALRSVD